MRTFAAITAGGVLGIFALKLLATIFLPIVGLVVGLFMMGVKIALFAAAAYFLYSFFFKRRRRGEVA